MSYHLAQLNIAQGKAPMDDPLMADFAAQLDKVNALAEASPGFVWRLKDESGNATNIQAFDDPKLLINMSVWESVEALRDFAYRDRDHTTVMRDRQRWFTPLDGPHLVLWWVPAGHQPDLHEAKARLARLAEQGPSPDAFTFAKSFPPPASQSKETA